MTEMRDLATDGPRDYSASRVHRLDLTAPQATAVAKVLAAGRTELTTADVKSWVMLKQIVARCAATVIEREGHPRFGKIVRIKIKGE